MATMAMEGETVSVEFGTWHAGSADPETPVLVRMKAKRNLNPLPSYAAVASEDAAVDCCSATKAGLLLSRQRARAMPEIVAPLTEENIADNFFESSLDEDEDCVVAEAEEVAALAVDLESGLGASPSPAKAKAAAAGPPVPSRVTFGNVTNLVGAAGRGGDGAKPGAPPDATANGKKKKTRHQRRNQVIGKLKEDLQAQQEFHREAERVAKNSERLATEVAQRSQVQLTLMREALDEALRGENSAIEGWKISDETVSQLLGLLRERESLWARAMWEYAYNAVLRRGRERVAPRGAGAAPVAAAEAELQAGGRRGRARHRAEGSSSRARGATRDRASKSLRNLEDSIDQLMEKLYNSQTSKI